MIRNTLGTVAILLLLAQAPLPALAKASQSPAAHSQNLKTPAAPGAQSHAPAQPASTVAAGSSTSLTPPGTGSPNATPDAAGQNNSGPENLPAPHISIATPAPAPAPWTWQQRVTWGANIVLVVFGYIAVMMGLSLLRKIERQTRYSEETAQVASDSARAALEFAQSMARAERPWVLISVRASQAVENGFVVTATNRGRGPARVVSTIDEVVSAVDEAHLPAAPEFRNEPAPPADPIILLPGESTEIFSFSRADLKRVCDTEERVARVEKWEEKIFFYGKVVYRELTARDDAPPFESSWLCWYIHGRQKSGMVMTGPPAYNQHS